MFFAHDSVCAAFHIRLRHVQEVPPTRGCSACRGRMRRQRSGGRRRLHSTHKAGFQPVLCCRRQICQFSEELQQVLQNKLSRSRSWLQETEGKHFTN